LESLRVLLTVSQQRDVGRTAVAKSVIEAIQVGNWHFEPDEDNREVGFEATSAMPGSVEKLRVLAERIRQGLPLWHPDDRHISDSLPTGDANTSLD
jgi:hypothetical protein